METERGKVTEQPVSSIKQIQGQAPPQQTDALQVPPLQTHAHEERGRKRDRQDSTPASGFVQQPESKRQRIDSLVEEEVSEEIMESPRRETSLHTPTSSFQQEKDRKQCMEVSSSTQKGEKPANTKASFKEIKAQNELLRVQLYEQFLKATPAKWERMMAAFDIKQEKMILSHFKPKVQQPQSAADFVKTQLEVLSKDVHLMDQIELHKQTTDMLYATLAEKATLAYELKGSLKNTNTQLDFERLSSTAKYNRIKTLEEIIVDLGHDPKDPKGVRTLMKKKDDDIAALKKRFRLLPTEHPQIGELQKKKEAEDQFDLMMRLNQRVIDLEGELEKELQGKQGESASQPPQRVPTDVATPSEPVALPNIPTTADATVETTTVLMSSMSVDDLIEAVNKLKLQATEINETKEKLAKLEEKYDKSKMTVAEQSREIKALKDRVKTLEKGLSLDRTLAEIKRLMWAKVNQSISGQWRSIQAIYEQVELLGRAKFENQRAKATLGSMPDHANRMINFLNHQTREELVALNIMNRTDAILTSKSVLTLRSFVQTLEARCRDIQCDVDSFDVRLVALQARGLPSLLISAGKLLTYDQYSTRLNNFVTNQLTAASSFATETWPPTGQTLYDKLESLFYLEHEVNHLFEMPPSY